jgi:hypothetical protein
VIETGDRGQGTEKAENGKQKTEIGSQRIKDVGA